MATAIKNILEVIAKIREGNLNQLAALMDQLTTLPSLLDALETEVNLKTSVDLLQEQVDKLEKTVSQSQRELANRMMLVEDSLKKQTDQLFRSDEEHKQMVEHVHSVLGQLEEYLRRHT
jgi:FtsZ-binding cell division protein ZapB